MATKFRTDTQMAGALLTIGGSLDLTNQGWVAANGVIRTKDSLGNIVFEVDAAGNIGTGSIRTVVVTGNMEITGTLRVSSSNFRTAGRQFAVHTSVGSWSGGSSEILTLAASDGPTGDGVSDFDFNNDLLEADRNLLVYKNGQLLESDTLSGGTSDYAISFVGGAVVLTFQGQAIPKTNNRIHVRFTERTP